MHNADQNHGIDPKYLSMPIIANQCQSINARILIGIDWHWALIEGVLMSSYVHLEQKLKSVRHESEEIVHYYHCISHLVHHCIMWYLALERKPNGGCVKASDWFY